MTGGDADARKSQYEVVQELFLSAVQIESASEREEWLKSQPTCSAEILEIVQSMLRSDASWSAKSSSQTAPNQASLRSYLPWILKDNSETDSFPQFQNYEILEEIARGGMGIVYRAWQRQPKRMVAIKMLRADRFATTSQIERFATEAQAAAQLDSESVVPIYEFGNVDGKPFIAMKFIDGQTLEDALNQGVLSRQACVNILVMVCDAIALAHDRVIVHRDIKPSNILIDRTTSRPWITDFGIAKYLEDELSGTNAGDVLGTPGYMPPELAYGNSQASSFSADVYGLGAILYRMLTGHPPIDTRGLDLANAIQRIRDHEIANPRSVDRSIPHSLSSICLKCLEREPNRRYENARELAGDLRRFLAGEPVQAKPPGPIRHLHQWARNRPGLAVSWIVLTVFYIYHITCRSFDWYNEPGFDRAAPIIALLAATSAWIWQLLLSRTHGSAGFFTYG